jgi:hypothetical protein
MMYLYAQAGSQHAINARTIRLYSSIVEVGKRIIDEYSQAVEKGHMPYKLDDFITHGRSFRIYQVEPDTGKVATKHMGKRLRDELSKQEELKPHFTKALLRS